MILGLEGSPTVASERSVWNGVVVTPSEKVFEPEEKEEGDEAMDVSQDNS